VDAQTLFSIASNTKLFTATALGLLVEEGTIVWDAPVITYLPWFQMWDPYVTRQLTIRDLLVHRSGLGLGAGDLLWWPTSSLDRKEVTRRLRFIPPATSFRSAYAYDNLLYLAAGEVIEAVSRQTWEDFVRVRILEKVGMTTSTARLSAMGGNQATAHAAVDGKVRPIARFISDNTNPAGGIQSNADDMARWMIVQLAHGKLADGSRLFSDSTWQQLTTLVTPMPIDSVPAEFQGPKPDFYGYALGLVVQDYRGRKVLAHGGSLPGFVSQVVMIPDANLGVAVLTNQESGAAFNAIVYHIVDHYLDAPAIDWLETYQKVSAGQKNAAAQAVRRAALQRNTASRASLPLSQYAGTYTDDWYGDIVIEEQDGRLTIRFTHTPALLGDLEHWQYDTFVAKWRDRELRADAYLTFALNPDGTIEQAKMAPTSPTVDFSYDFQDLLLKRKRTP
jgi:CubicO group peptidase (beta-lactamase class C family)